MSERKRKHDAVSTSADEDRNPSAVAAAATGSSVGGGANKSVKLNEDSDTHRCSSRDEVTPTFSDLPPVIVGKISTYIKLSAWDCKRDAVPAAEPERRTLMSLCTAVGPTISSYIRKSYLEGNLSFLAYLEDWITVRSCSYDDDLCALIGAKLRQWMEYNPWWREACQSPSAFMAKQQRHHPTIYKLLSVKKPESDEEREKFEEEVGITPSGLLRMPLECFTRVMSDETFDETFSLAVSLNGKPSPLYPAQSFTEYVQQDPGSDMKVIVMHESFGQLFFNPVLSTNLGLLELLRFQLEDLALDVN